MIFVNKKILVIILIAIANLHSQTPKDQFSYANELFNEGKYFDAITQFKRLQFFDSENQFSFQSNILIGKSYKAGAKFDDAIKYFTLAEISSRNDEEYFNSNILKARTNILRRTNHQAERILNELLVDTKFKSKENEIKYWLGWNLIFLDEWKKASKIFLENNLDTTLSNLCISVDDKMYSVNFAKYSSYVIPGFGQFYTGEYVSGLLTLCSNVFAGYLTVNSFIEDRVFDGIITSNFLWMRFYSGNTQNAEKFALQKNLEISNKALNYLQFQFKGEKP